MPLELRNRYAALQEAETREESFACAREIYRLRRKWRDEIKADSFAADALRMPRADRKKGGQVSELDIGGRLTSKPEDWSKGILDFYRGLYTDPLNDVEGRLSRLRTGAEHEAYIHLPLWVVERSRLRPGSGLPLHREMTASPGESSIPYPPESWNISPGFSSTDLIMPPKAPSGNGRRSSSL
jgi:hypothetical protein